MWRLFYLSSNQLSFQHYQPSHIFLADECLEPGVAAAGVGSGAGADMVAIGIFGEEIFACCLARAEVIGREDCTILVHLLLPVANKAVALHQ